MKVNLSKRFNSLGGGSQTSSEEDGSSLAKTAIEASLFTTAQIISTPLIKALKLPVGRASSAETEKMLREKPFTSLLLIAGVAPPIEEALFRLLPSYLIAGKNNGQRWDVGVPASAIFALVHSLKFEDGQLLEKKIPLYQFTGGLFFWYLMRERGYTHTTLGHSTVNAIAISIGRLLYETFPGTSVPSEPIGSEIRRRERKPHL